MKHFSIWTATALSLAIASGCSDAPDADSETRMEESALEVAEFNENYRDYLKRLSSDEFEGRAPASDGEELTVDMLSSKFAEWGLKPYNSETGSYEQKVPLVKMIPYKVSSMTFSGDTAVDAFEYRTEMMAWSPRVVEDIQLDNSEVVFVGYGIVAPEYDWNDYEDLDVEGKTVVMLVNDPGYDTQDAELFNGSAMTYYGRWTYKYEEAARQGAAAALVIHETGPAGYGWGVVAGGSPVRFDLARDNKNMDRVQVEGWITSESADQLFAAQGKSLAEMREQAQRTDFAAVSLNTALNVRVQSKFEYLDSSNVVGYIEGTETPEEHVIYMAHWDHLGVDPINTEDPIYNGAQDNASGTAGLLAIAEKFAQAPAPKRSIVFAAVAAEERGLLGSDWYANNPLFPLSKAVAGINMDVMNVYGPVRDMVVVGFGNSELEDYLERYVQPQNRYIAPEPTPEVGSFYRSDHFNLAKKGVPMLYAKGGNDHFEHGRAHVEEQRAEYIRTAYHKPADEYNEDWDLRGVQQDLSVYFSIGSELANSDAWPSWNDGNEFKAIRDETADQRQ
ncbi:Zn-dependent amino- or carboxypeptidase, M28 family [Pseudidiomarina planktonica]|uniref:Zn-dependent amino- or carboxypeptidase, M28 family n=1 Tax=Pseudidiomarina planktonica TaxID=1323738 RepID=A0A1Y6EUH0_9GAMM|nr:M28 family metallopeptidase [Pseudidiomarina planktonica]RUO65464.1 peptidase M28 [Pseudidiomarina planktonica]SMQ64881.1 Zn-dependent amino- or carboxypeptidase, M28 family [Pseudidiomarina planktonica]